MKENIESQAADLILGSGKDGDKFRLIVLGITLKLKISPLTTHQFIEISKHLSRVSLVDQEVYMFPEMVQRSGELKHICKSIAIATGSRIPFLHKIIEYKADIEDLYTLMQIVRRQSNPERFFFTMTLARGMNQLKKTQK